jgi:hypothetical protein
MKEEGIEMNLHNPYEVEFLRADRVKQIARQVEQYRGPAREPRKGSGSWVSAAMAFIALLPAGVVLSAVASLMTVQ